MRGIIGAIGLAALFGIGLTPQSQAFPAGGRDFDPAYGMPQTRTPEGYGSGRAHEYRRALRRNHGHPGAQYELRQSRRIYCRNTPERC